MTEQQRFEGYVTELQLHLRALPRPVREEIVREIAAHIRDAAEAPGASMAVVLARLGPAKELAREYSDGALLQRASRSLSPALLLRAALRLATKGFFGVLVLFFGVFGYAFGVGFVLAALGKLLFPAHTGLWMQNGQIIVTGALVEVPPPPAHEVLGWHYLPLALALGGLLLAVTTVLIRLCLRLSRHWQAQLQTGPLAEAQLFHGRA